MKIMAGIFMIVFIVTFILEWIMGLPKALWCAAGEKTWQECNMINTENANKEALGKASNFLKGNKGKTTNNKKKKEDKK